MNILLSCIGKRGYLADFFRNELDSRSKIIGTSNTHWTPGFSACDYAAVLPPISSDDYIPALLDVCQKYDVRALLSFFDPDVHKLSLYRNWFFEAGVLPVIPSHTAADLSFDKLKTWNYMNDIGVPSPHTSASLQDSKELLEKGIFHFPLIIKPRFGFGSHNTFIARNIKEMEVFFDYAPHMIIQNYIEGEALNVDGLGDMNSNPLAVVPWRKLLSKLGETERAITISDPELVELANKLVQNIGIIGPFDGDFFRDSEGRLWLLELNLRFGGGYPVSHLAGANFPKMIINMVSGDTAEKIAFSYKSGVTMMKKLAVISGPDKETYD